MKQWKRLTALLAAASLALTCGGCGKTATTAYQKGNTPAGNLTGLKIAYSSVAGAEEAPWAGVLWNELESICQEKGWEFDGLSAGGVPATQDKQIDQLLAEDPDYFIIFAGDVTMADEWVKEIHNAGVPVIMAGIDASAGVQEYVSAFVGPDQEALASQLASDMIQKNGADAGLNVVCISGFECQQDYILRRQGYEKTLSYFSNYSLLATEYAGASREEAKSIMEELYRDYGKTIDAVMCYDDEFAMGALEAIQTMGLEKEIQIYSITGSNEAISAVEEGLLTEVAMVSAAEIAQGCADVISGLEQGIIPDHHNYTSRTYINAETAKEYAGKGEY